MPCFCSDNLFKVAHFFAHSENLALSFTFHLLWDTLSGALSVQLLRTESINRRWWSNPNRGQRLNVFVARFARGVDTTQEQVTSGECITLSTPVLKLFFYTTKIRLLEIPINYCFNSRGSIICYNAICEWVQSIMMRPRSNPNTKAKIQCFSWAQVPALKSYCTSAPLAAVPTKIQNTEGIRKIGKYEICMKYFDMSRCMVI